MGRNCFYFFFSFALIFFLSHSNRDNSVISNFSKGLLTHVNICSDVLLPDAEWIQVKNETSDKIFPIKRSAALMNQLRVL